MCLFIRVALYSSVTHSSCSTWSANGNYKSTNCPSLFIFEVLFIYFSYWRLHWCFPYVVDLQGLHLCLVVFPLIVEDCLKLQHYCLDIIGNFHFRFINCNDWTVIFFQFKFSLTILCSGIRQSVVACTLAPGTHFMVRDNCYETFFKSPGRGILQTSFERHRLPERVG